MKYVIKYIDGAYNRGMGHPVTLLEADVYSTKEEAELVLKDLGEAYIEHYATVPDKIDAATEALWLVFTSYYDVGIGAKPTKEEIKLILSQIF